MEYLNNTEQVPKKRYLFLLDKILQILLDKILQIYKIFKKW